MLSDIGARAVIEGLQDYLDGMRRMAEGEKAVGDAADRAGRSHEEVTGRLGNLDRLLRQVLGPTLKEFQGELGVVSEGLEAVGAGLTASAVATGAAVAAFAAVGIELVKMASEEEQAVIAVQNHAGITRQAAEEIVRAFEEMGRQSLYSGEQTAAAFAPVAGRLQSLTGDAANAENATALMAAAQDLAAASGQSLDGVTQGLAATMLAYHIPLSDAATASDQLLNASNLTGVSIGELSMAVDRMGARLPGVTPPLQDMGALLKELSDSGISGQRALMSVTSGLETLMGGSKATTDALKILGVQVYDEQGRFRGLRAVIGDLAPALDQYSEQGRTAAESALFGAGAAGEWDKIIRDSIPGFDDAAAAIGRQGTAADGAAAANASLQGQIDHLKNTAGEAGQTIGGALLPAINDIADAINTRAFPAVGEFFRFMGTAIHQGIIELAGLQGAWDELARHIVAAYATFPNAPAAYAFPGSMSSERTTAGYGVGYQGFIGPPNIPIPDADYIARQAAAIAAYQEATDLTMPPMPQPPPRPPGRNWPGTGGGGGGGGGGGAGSVASAAKEDAAALREEQQALTAERQAQEAAARAVQEHRDALVRLADTILGQLKPAFDALFTSLGAGTAAQAATAAGLVIALAAAGNATMAQAAAIHVPQVAQPGVAAPTFTVPPTAAASAAAAGVAAANAQAAAEKAATAALVGPDRAAAWGGLGTAAGTPQLAVQAGMAAAGGADPIQLAAQRLAALKAAWDAITPSAESAAKGIGTGAAALAAAGGSADAAAAALTYLDESTATVAGSLADLAPHERAEADIILQALADLRSEYEVGAIGAERYAAGVALFTDRLGALGKTADDLRTKRIDLILGTITGGTPVPGGAILPVDVATAFAAGQAQFGEQQWIASMRAELVRQLTAADSAVGEARDKILADAAVTAKAYWDALHPPATLEELNKKAWEQIAADAKASQDEITKATTDMWIAMLDAQTKAMNKAIEQQQEAMHTAIQGWNTTIAALAATGSAGAALASGAIGYYIDPATGRSVGFVGTPPPGVTVITPAPASGPSYESIYGPPQTGGESVAAFAAGGWVPGRPGQRQTAWVGERGPELVSLPAGAHVQPVSRSVSYNVTANYTRPEEPQGIRYELEVLAMRAAL